jgi:D-beta-D-heptose 7-phosphate kinase/D-beta-D-heptose 1-phosphate adenosyltransferase
MQTVFPHTKTPVLLVIGDLMVDHTILGTVSKLANEGPIPVLHKQTEVWTLGGCGNVAVNCKALGADVFLFSAIGDDAGGTQALELIRDNSIKWIGSTISNYRTTIKHRGFADSKLVFRYDDEEFLHTPLTQSLLHFLKDTPVDAVLFSDYKKGVCNKELIKEVIEYCSANNIPTTVDPKGDFRMYNGCTIIKPNREETIRFLQSYCNESIEDINACQTISSLLAKHVSCSYTCITMAKDGLCLYSTKDSSITSAKTQSIEVIDVTGAGDIVNSVLGYSLACNISISDMARCAAFLATQSVQHKGTYILQPQDFFELRNYLKQSKCIQLEDLAFLSSKPRIVFTNGCFDLLHAGHIQSLQFAKRQGELLVVGINSDESVRELKGASRPILSIHERVRVLEAVECVDYICVFSNEDMLMEIVKTLRPSVLVKGEEYREKHIPSAIYAGKVEFAPAYPGISTTEILRRQLPRERGGGGGGVGGI